MIFFLPWHDLSLKQSASVCAAAGTRVHALLLSSK